MTPKATAAALILLAAPAIPLAGCGGNKTEVTASSTTKGQELQDLEEARSKGLITESEYKKQRKKILERD